MDLFENPDMDPDLKGKALLKEVEKYLKKRDLDEVLEKEAHGVQKSIEEHITGTLGGNVTNSGEVDDEGKGEVYRKAKSAFKGKPREDDEAAEDEDRPAKKSSKTKKTRTTSKRTR